MNRIALAMALAILGVLATAPAWAAGLNDVKRALVTPFKAETPDGQRIADYTADFFQESRIASLDRLQRARGEVKVRFDYDRRPGGDRVPTVMFHWEYQEPTRQELVSDGRTMWVYLPENNQVIQSDIEMVSKARDNDPLTFLTGLGNLDRDFLINWAEPNRDVKGNYVLDLRPRRTTALINRMVIVVDRYAVDTETAGPSSAPAETASALRSRDSRPPVPETTDTSVSRSSAFFADNFDPRQAASASSGSGSAAGENLLAGSGFSQRRRSGGQAFPILSTTVYDPNGNSTIIEFSNVRINRGLSAGQFSFMLPAGVEVVRPTGKEMGF